MKSGRGMDSTGIGGLVERPSNRTQISYIDLLVPYNDVMF